MAEFPCKNCGQWVEIVERKKGILGKTRVEVERKLINVLSGKGGPKKGVHDCPNKYDKPFPCKLCGQDIYISSKKKFESGKPMVCNFRTSMTKGGLQDEKHVCPYRLFSQFHKTGPPLVYNPMRYCIWCVSYWDETKYINCPNCWYEQCRKCGHKMDTLVKKPGWSTRKVKKFMYPKDSEPKTYDEVVIDIPCQNCGSTENTDLMRVYK